MNQGHPRTTSPRACSALILIDPQFSMQTPAISVRRRGSTGVRSSSQAAWRRRQDRRGRESCFLLTLRRSLFFALALRALVLVSELAVSCRVLDTSCFDSWTVSASLAFTRRVISRLSPVFGMIDPLGKQDGGQSKSADRDRHPVSASAGNSSSTSSFRRSLLQWLPGVRLLPPPA
jgi:hypothetical protein